MASLAIRWKWSRSKVNKFVFDLKKEQQIDFFKSYTTTIITILNYEKYQENEQLALQQKSSRKAAEKQQKDIFKNVKNVKNVKNNNNIYIPKKKIKN